MPESWVIRNGAGTYLERVPFDRSFQWLASSIRYATTFTKLVAEAKIYELDDPTARLQLDPLNREPEIRVVPLSGGGQDGRS